MSTHQVRWNSIPDEVWDAAFAPNPGQKKAPKPSYIAIVYRWANREGRKLKGARSRLAHDVLIELVTYTDLETGVCFPRRATLAENLFDTDQPTEGQLNKITNAFGVLEDACLIKREKRTLDTGRFTSSLYHVALPAYPSTQSGWVDRQPKAG